MTRRMPSQDRGHATRAALLKAAMEMVAEVGMAGVSHRKVAERAGVSTGMTSYFFESMHSLTSQAVREHYAAWTAEVEALVAGIAHEQASIDAAVDAAAEIVAGISQEEVLALDEVYLNAARDPALREMVVPVRESLRSVAASIASSFGIDDGAGFARALVAMIEGHQLRRLAEDAEVSGPLADDLRLLVIGALALQEDGDRWRARIARPGGDDASSGGGDAAAGGGDHDPDQDHGPDPDAARGSAPAS